MFHVKHQARADYSSLVDLLIERNRFVNLTGIRDKEGIYLKHIQDSLELSRFILSFFPEAKTLVDIGTGAGFPGLVLARECPFLHVTLLDSVGKKIAFVQEAIDLLGLKNATATCQRAESLGEVSRFFYDLACFRSVAKLDVLLEYSSPLLRLGGSMLALKSESIDEELNLALKVCRRLGFSYSSEYRYYLNGKCMSVLVFNKTHQADICLPRRVGLAASKPLSGR